MNELRMKNLSKVKLILLTFSKSHKAYALFPHEISEVTGQRLCSFGEPL